MNTFDRFGLMLLVALLLGVFAFFTINIGKDLSMGDTKYTLKPYNGNGSTVLKHGTIVKVVDDKPVVVGHFDKDDGSEFPGTLEIQKVD